MFLPSLLSSSTRPAQLLVMKSFFWSGYRSFENEKSLYDVIYELLSFQWSQDILETLEYYGEDI